MPQLPLYRTSFNPQPQTAVETIWPAPRHIVTTGYNPHHVTPVSSTASFTTFNAKAHKVPQPTTVPQPELSIRLQLAAAKYIGEAEQKYGRKAIMYCEEYKGPSKLKGVDGGAPGFNASMCNFTSISQKSSDALRSFFHGETVCECHSLCCAVFYRAILEEFGDDIFNALFPRLTFGTSLGWKSTPLNRLVDRIPIRDDNESSVLRGDWIYIKNDPRYKTKHPRGVAGGWNVICISVGDPKKYIGLGLTGTSAGVSLQEIRNKLRDEYNKNPVQTNLTEPERAEILSMDADVFSGPINKRITDRWGNSTSASAALLDPDMNNHNSKGNVKDKGSPTSPKLDHNFKIFDDMMNKRNNSAAACRDVAKDGGIAPFVDSGHAIRRLSVPKIFSYLTGSQWNPVV